MSERHAFTRRQFLRDGLCLVSATTTLPLFLQNSAHAMYRPGARTSSLHAFDLHVSDGVARFAVHPHQDSDADESRVVLPVLEHRDVRPSTGAAEQRPVVVATVALGAHELQVELTLTDRDAMGFRMLLGRTALAGRFLVDPAISYAQGSRPRR